MESITKKRVAWNKGKKGVQVSWNKGGHVINSGSFSKGHIQPKGEKSPTWKGGAPTCSECGKIISLGAKKCRQHSQRGSEAPVWKGGKETEKQRASFNQQRRETRKKGNGGSHTFEEWEELKSKYDFMCLCCKRNEPEIKLTEDHILPISKGGRNEISNIQPLCRSCNSRKLTKTIDYISFYETNNILI